MDNPERGSLSSGIGLDYSNSISEVHPNAPLPPITPGYSEVAIIAEYLGRGMRPHHTSQSLSAARDVSRFCRPSIRGYSTQTNINIRQNGKSPAFPPSHWVGRYDNTPRHRFEIPKNLF